MCCGRRRHAPPIDAIIANLNEIHQSLTLLATILRRPRWPTRHCRPRSQPAVEREPPAAAFLRPDAEAADRSNDLTSSRHAQLSRALGRSGHGSCQQMSEPLPVHAGSAQESRWLTLEAVRPPAAPSTGSSPRTQLWSIPSRPEGPAADNALPHAVAGDLARIPARRADRDAFSRPRSMPSIISASCRRDHRRRNGGETRHQRHGRRKQTVAGRSPCMAGRRTNRTAITLGPDKARNTASRPRGRIA